MAQKIYNGSIALTKLNSAIITTKKGNRAIIIPIEENYLLEKDGAIYMSVNVITKDEQDQYGQNGFISQTLPSDKYKELGKDKAKEISLPILGNIKNFQSNDSSGAEVIQGETNPEDDDLPF